MRNCPTKNTTGFFASWKSKLFRNRLRKFQNFSEKEKRKKSRIQFYTGRMNYLAKKNRKSGFLIIIYFFHFFPQNISENSLYSKINPWQKSRINGKYLLLFLCCAVIWNSLAFYPYLRAFLAFFAIYKYLFACATFTKKKV